MLDSRIGVKISITVLALLITLLIISVFTASPDDLGPYGITIWFVVLFASLSGLLAVFLYWYKKLAKRQLNPRQRLLESVRQGILMSIFLISLLALNSLKQLSLRDVVLISLLLVLVEFYMRRMR